MSELTKKYLIVHYTNGTHETFYGNLLVIKFSFEKITVCIEGGKVLKVIDYRDVMDLQF